MVTPSGVQRRELCAGVGAAFTSRLGGASTGSFGALNLGQFVGDDPEAVDANRALVLRELGRGREAGGPGPEAGGQGPSSMAWLRQVHGADVVYAGDPPVQDQEADAFFTDSPAVVLAIVVADCAPVLLADPEAGLVGAAHAGRPGLAAGVVPALVEAMAGAGAEPGRMSALIGPSICGECYEVPEWMRDEVAVAAPGSGCVTRAGTPGLDLRAGLRAQLAGAGVVSVAGDARCTAESAELYSYRRDGSTGRFAGLIWLAA